MLRKLFLYSSLSIILFFTSCGGGQNNDHKQKRNCKGNINCGGILKLNEVENFRNLFPITLTEITSQKIVTQVYEGLVKLNQKDLSFLPCLAEKWDVNADATVWTFHLRKGVKFHDDPCFPDGKGREVTAKDFKYSLDMLCSAITGNAYFGVTFQGRVVGANEYFKSTQNKNPLAQGVEGIKVLDDYTLEIKLLNSYAEFLNILSTPGCWVFPKEAYDKYKEEMRIKAVGTGPFVVKNVKEGEYVVLERNDSYWGFDEAGNQLPYLDGVKYTFIKEKKSELLEFKRGNLDMIFRLPTEMIPEILGELDKAKEGKNLDFDIQVVPAMSMFYYGFQQMDPVFKKKEVRQAFNYAIDREKIVTYILQGEGIPASHGIVPPAFKDYNINDVNGYVYDPDKAKQLLAKAGYPGGKGFPRITLQTNSGGGSGDRNIQTAESIQRMLKENLGIEVDINVMPHGEHIEAMETGKATFYRSSWTADFPDPSSFLMLLYGELVPSNPTEKSLINHPRYINPAFDSLLSAGMREIDNKKRFELYKKADQIATDDAALMPVFYDENYRLLQLYVKNFDANALEYHDLSRVYLLPKTDE